ncbi:hypothetical protein HIM_02529 [Hirsutella minnesotensis 3608]|nr:hypothetical protein HIM_02529 [Hirsutella minnesotensis 3608]
MFCSSLRKRREWSPAVARLANSPGLGWKETKLETHDVAFAMPSQQGPEQIFRLVLLSAAQVGMPQTTNRIERLGQLDGHARMAVVLLVTGQDDMAALMALQMQYKTSLFAMLVLLGCSDARSRMLEGYDMPVIPVTSSLGLPACLESLRAQCAAQRVSNGQRHEKVLAQRDLLAYCARGAPLSKTQTNVLSDICSSFGNLAQQTLNPGGQKRIYDYLGDVDGRRVVAFFTAGPSTGLH